MLLCQTVFCPYQVKESCDAMAQLFLGRICFLCEQSVDLSDKDTRKVATLSCQETIKEKCKSRGYDEWALQVQGTLESCHDLPAVDAVYH